MTQSAQVNFDDLLAAYEWVSSSPGECEAFVSRLTGSVHWSSSTHDIDEKLPADIDNASLYVAVPNSCDLNLGKHLALSFAEDHLADSYPTIARIFHQRGAYRRFKDLLERKDCLHVWYDYEAKATAQALRTWAAGEGILIASASGQDSG